MEQKPRIANMVLDLFRGACLFITICITVYLKNFTLGIPIGKKSFS